MVDPIKKEKKTKFSKNCNSIIFYYILLCILYLQEFGCYPYKSNHSKPKPLVEFLDVDEAKQFGFSPENIWDSSNLSLVTKSRKFTLELDETTYCDVKKSVTQRAAEDAIYNLREHLEYPLQDQNVTNVQLMTGHLHGFNTISKIGDVIVTCNDSDIIIRANFILPNVQINYDWKVTFTEDDGFIWATGEDIYVNMVASVSSSAVNFPTVRIREMKITEIGSFDSGNQGMNVFESLGDPRELFQNIFKTSVENALTETMSLELQLLIAQSWYKTHFYPHDPSDRRVQLPFHTLFPGFGSKETVAKLMKDFSVSRTSGFGAYPGMIDDVFPFFGNREDFIVGMPLINHAKENPIHQKHPYFINATAEEEEVNREYEFDY